MIQTSLSQDSAERKKTPVASGCLAYFPAALAGVARHSVRGNDKHNPGQPLHHARGKSQDHADCVVRHLMDIADYIALLQRGVSNSPTSEIARTLLEEADALCWRSLALSQYLYETLAGAPLAPGAKEYKDAGQTV